MSIERIQEVLEENESMQDLILSGENLSRPAMAPLTSMQVMWVNSQDAGVSNINYQYICIRKEKNYASSRVFSISI